MLPAFSLCNALYAALRHSKQAAYLCLRHSRGIQAANLAHLIVCYFGVMAFFTAQYRLAASAFGEHVIHILGVRTKPKMSRIDARGIVTIVADLFIIWNGAKVNFPTNAWGRGFATAPRFFARAYQSAPAVILDACPLPTVIWAALIDLLPKALLERQGFVMAANEAITDWLAAAAFAKFLEWNLKLICLWGMIAHVVSASNAIGHAWDTRNVARHSVLGFSHSIIARMSGFGLSLSTGHWRSA